MAIATTATHLYLDDVFDFFNISQYAGNGLDVGNCLPNYPYTQSSCDSFPQFPYQSRGKPQLSIETLARYLHDAETMIQRRLSFNPYGGFSVDVTEPPSNYKREEGLRLGIGTRLIMNTKCIKALGQQELTLVDTATGIVFSGPASNNFNDKFTATFSLGATFDKNDIGNLYVVRSGYNGNARYKVPVTIEGYDDTTKTLIVSGAAWDMISIAEILDTSWLRDRALDLCAVSYDTSLDLCLQKASSTLVQGRIISSGAYASCFLTTTTASCIETNIPFCANIVDCKEGIIDIVSFGTEDTTTGLFTASAVVSEISNILRIELSILSGCECTSYIDKDYTVGVRLDDVCTEVKRATFLLLSSLLPIAECTTCPALISQLEIYQQNYAQKSQSVNYNPPRKLLAQSQYGFTYGALLAESILEQLESNSCGSAYWTRNI